MAPRTSILTATRDRPDYLAEAIASVEAQTDPDWEHLVYDNGSDPRTRDLLRRAKAENPTQFFYTSPGCWTELPVSYYWNVLVGLSRGQYVTLLDDDNRKDPRFLERMVGVLEAWEHIGAVSCGWRLIDEKGAVTGERHWNRATSLRTLWQSNTIDSNAFVVRRSVLDGIGSFATSLATCEDWHLIIRLFRACRMMHLEDTLLDYRDHPGARSRTAGKSHDTWARIRRDLFPEGVPEGALDNAIHEGSYK